jgi:murein DD-endopeptidase MepM/ murein hydrolase activator NlpD
MKFWKSPFFYAFLGVVCLVVGGIFLSSSPHKTFSSQSNFLDESQYLFPQTNSPSKIVDLNIIESAFLEPAAPAFLVKGKVFGALGETLQNKEITQYIVQPGDTLSSIAQEFNISLETLLWANNLTMNSVIKPGQKLVILPVSGVLHIVREGETLSEISQIYQTKVEDIVEFNELEDEGKIYAGDLLIIPGGKKPKREQKYVQVPLSQSYFICPIPSPCRITQGLHWFNAVDFSNGKCGEPVFAAAGGTVQRTGYGRISGYFVRILHPNGVVTFYGHLGRIIVKPGQRVYQGQIIGYVGYSGLTYPRGPAGCHLHFDVRFAKNPFARYPVGTTLGK